MLAFSQFKHYERTSVVCYTCDASELRRRSELSIGQIYESDLVS